MSEVRGRTQGSDQNGRREGRNHLTEGDTVHFGGQDDQELVSCSRRAEVEAHPVEKRASRASVELDMGPSGQKRGHTGSRRAGRTRRRRGPSTASPR